MKRHSSPYLTVTPIGFRAHILQSADGRKASRSSSWSIPSESKQHGYKETLDELTLEHMTQDCSLLKNQLLKLKVLLQV